MNENLSIYIPHDKNNRLVQRLKKVAKDKDRSINYVVVEAILEFLNENEHSAGETAERHVQKEPAPPKEAGAGEGPRSSRKRTPALQSISNGVDYEEPAPDSASAEEAVRREAVLVAELIGDGEAPIYVRSNPRGNKIHVVISHASPRDGDTFGLPMETWRSLFRSDIAHELRKLGWEDAGGNRYRKPLAATDLSRDREVRQSKRSGLTGCQGPSLALAVWTAALCAIGYALLFGHPTGVLAGIEILRFAG